MTVTIILNGVSQKKKKFYREIYPLLSRNFELNVLETRYVGHARELAFQLTENGASPIIAAGGDGTMHEVVNGVLKSGKHEPVLGLIPLGSGNDFARATSLSLDPEQILQLLKTMKPLSTDVGSVRCISAQGEEILEYFTNACSLGMGPEVVSRLEKSRKSLGPSLSYLIAIISTFLTLKPKAVHCKTANWEWKGEARVVALANGVSFGNATYIAPDASVDDGSLNAFVAGNFSLLRFLMYLNIIKRKKKINDSGIHYQSVMAADLTGEEKCPLEADGELIGFLPAHVEILAGRINFLR